MPVEPQRVRDHSDTAFGRGEPAAAESAAAAAATWRAIDAALAPVIGLGGVAALHKRSLQLARVAHPCLAEAYEHLGVAGDHSGLQAVLARQSAAEAAAANADLLRGFRELLAKLIGASLATRLLRPACSPDGDGSAAQEPSP